MAAQRNSKHATELYGAMLLLAFFSFRLLSHADKINIPVGQVMQRMS